MSNIYLVKVLKQREKEREIEKEKPIPNEANFIVKTISPLLASLDSPERWKVSVFFFFFMFSLQRRPKVVIHDSTRIAENWPVFLLNPVSELSAVIVNKITKITYFLYK